MKIFGYFLLFLFVITNPVWSAPKICDLIDLPNCSGVTKQGRRTSNQSYPSPSTSASVNPAKVSFDRGPGIEIIHQSGNPLLFSIASGSGKFGGELISTNLENGFFGEAPDFRCSVQLFMLHEFSLNGTLFFKSRELLSGTVLFKESLL